MLKVYLCWWVVVQRVNVAYAQGIAVLVGFGTAYNSGLCSGYSCVCGLGRSICAAGALLGRSCRFAHDSDKCASQALDDYFYRFGCICNTFFIKRCKGPLFFSARFTIACVAGDTL